jgi:hypothetical protein
VRSSWIFILLLGSPLLSHGQVILGGSRCVPNHNFHSGIVTNHAVTVNTHNFHHNVQRIVVVDQNATPIVVAVPVAEAVPVSAQLLGLPYYYSAGERYSQQAMLRQIIKEELRSLQTAPAPNPPQPGNGAPVKSPNTKGDSPIGSGEPDNETPADLQAAIINAFKGKGNCLACHGNGQAQGGLRLTGSDGKLIKLSSDKKWKVYGMSASGWMPPAARNDASKAMEAEHLPNLLKWAIAD